MKIIKKENFRVEVYPFCRVWNDGNEKELFEKCKDLKEEIERHIDFEKIDINYDIKELCSFCGSNYETEENGMPVCCGKAQDEWEKRR